MRTCRQDGDSPLRAFYTSRRILKSILRQEREAKTRQTQSLFLIAVRTLAAAFWISCRLLLESFGHSNSNDFFVYFCVRVCVCCSWSVQQQINECDHVCKEVEMFLENRSLTSEFFVKLLFCFSGLGGCEGVNSGQKQKTVKPAWFNINYWRRTQSVRAIDRCPAATMWAYRCLSRSSTMIAHHLFSQLCFLCRCAFFVVLFFLFGVKKKAVSHRNTRLTVTYCRH